MLPKTFNRWWVVVGAVAIQLCLGAIYAWSAFTGELTSPLEEGGLYGFSAKQAAWIFSAGLATFAVVMVVAGRVLPKVGPRPLAISGGIVLGAGYMLGGLLGSSFITQLLCIGIIGGAGIGLAYVVPISVGVKWFPDKKGAIAGIAVAGFGFGAVLWVQLAGNWFGGLLNTTNLFSLPGVQSVFFIYGLTFLLIVLLGSIVMTNPPPGYQPKGWTPPTTEQKAGASGGIDFSSRAMLKTPQFYMLWLMFLGSALAGLMVIYCIQLFGIDALQASGVAEGALAAGIIAGTAMSWLAIFNGLGRILWGIISDRLGRKPALIAVCGLQGIIMPLLLTFGGNIWGLILGACVVGFNFGGILALFPAATADYFGNRNVGTNYGWIFLAYGVAGIVGPLVAGFYKDSAAGDVEAWSTPFLIAAATCLIAAGIGAFLKPPKAA